MEEEGGLLGGLEESILEHRAQRVRALAAKLGSQKAFLREERRILAHKAALLEVDVRRFRQVQRYGFFPDAHFVRPDARRLKLNVGGQAFEVSEALARRDEQSLLAALAGGESPLEPGEEGVFFFDRDWWLFRFVLHFLRDGVLPEDATVLRDLYLEGTFWRLTSLHRAIEERRLDVRRHTYRLDPEGRAEEIEVAPGGNWWDRKPTWWEQTDPRSKDDQGWWKSDRYRGKSLDLQQQWWNRPENAEVAAGTAATGGSALRMSSTWTAHPGAFPDHHHQHGGHYMY